MFNEAVVDQVVILFLIMAIGVIGRKKKILNDEVKKGITDLIMVITLPCMVVASFDQKFSEDMLMNAGIILLCAIVIHIVSYFGSKVLYFKFPEERQSVLRYFTVFSNAGFMGYPVLEAMYGKTGVFYASIYNIPVRVFVWTLGILLFTKKSKETNYFKQIFLNPGMIAVVIGMIPFLLSMQFPVIISKTLNMVGSMTTPLSMIMVGAMLGDAEVKGMFEGKIFYGAFIRLIMSPIITLIVLKGMHVNSIILGVTVVLTAMPAASFTAILAGKFNADEVFASKCVFMTTMISVITIPAIVMLI